MKSVLRLIGEWVSFHLNAAIPIGQDNELPADYPKRSADIRARRSHKAKKTMHPTVQITFEGVRHSDVIESYIREELENLGALETEVTSATVIVAQPRAKHFSGDPYRLRLRLTTDGGPDVNVNHDPGTGRTHDAMRIAVRDAFRTARRSLENRARLRTGVSTLS